MWAENQKEKELFPSAARPIGRLWAANPTAHEFFETHVAPVEDTRANSSGCMCREPILG